MFRALYGELLEGYFILGTALEKCRVRFALFFGWSWRSPGIGRHVRSKWVMGVVGHQPKTKLPSKCCQDGGSVLSETCYWRAEMRKDTA